MRLVFLLGAVCFLSGCADRASNTVLAPKFDIKVFNTLKAGTLNEEEVFERIGKGFSKYYRVRYQDGAENNVLNYTGKEGELRFYAVRYSTPKAKNADFIVYEAIFEPNGRFRSQNVYETD
jgi:hypothetical protein